MMNVKLMKLCILFFMGLKSISLLFAAGAGSSGGGDRYRHDFEAAWFLGNQPISYCIEKAKSFPLSEDKIKQTISAVISQWKKYVEDKNIDKGIVEYSKLKLNFNYVLSKKCTKDTMLTFYLGVNSPRVEKAKSNFSNPIAFAWKEKYNYSLRLSKGLIWVKSNPLESTNGGKGSENPWWKKNDPFYGILLHEMGHVLGNSHVPGTIMDDHITKWLFVDSNFSNNRYIDHVAELAQQESSELLYTGLPNMNNTRSKEAFKLLTGRESVGHVESIFKMNSMNNKPGKLIFKDQVSEYTFDIKIDESAWARPYGARKVFKKAYYIGKSLVKDSNYIEHLPFTGFGTLTTPGGVKFTMLLEYNFLKYPFIFGSLDGNLTGIDIAFDNSDLNYEIRYANIPYEIFIFNKHKKMRVFGPSAYWNWFNTFTASAEASVSSTDEN